MRKLFAGLAATCVLAGGPALAADLDEVAVRKIEATAYDYVDGQLEGDVARVTRVLHPDLAKRTPKPDSPHETLGLSRMTSDELIRYTREGALKTPREQWNRSCRVLDVAGDAAAVRAEAPWFVDYFHMGKFGDRWVIVNAQWHSKP